MVEDFRSEDFKEDGKSLAMKFKLTAKLHWLSLV